MQSQGMSGWSCSSNQFAFQGGIESSWVAVLLIFDFVAILDSRLASSFVPPCPEWNPPVEVAASTVEAAAAFQRSLGESTRGRDIKGWRLCLDVWDFSIHIFDLIWHHAWCTYFWWHELAWKPLVLIRFHWSKPDAKPEIRESLLRILSKALCCKWLWPQKQWAAMHN